MVQTLDPGRPRTMDEFISALRTLKICAGNPSVTQITKRIHHVWRKAGRPASEWPARSTVGNCFQLGRRRPNVDLLMAVVHVLVDGDPAVVARWHHALRAVLGDQEASGHVVAYDRLPAAPASFVGRTVLIDHATTLLAAPGRGRARPLVLEGMPGIGKTALALHLGHRLLDRGGTALFADLRGFSADGPPAAPEATLRTFLRLLGVTGGRIPHDLKGKAALYRRRLAETRAVVILDDAASAEQVRPLLAPGVLTIVTSRQALSRLDGAYRLTLPPLTPAEALAMMRHEAGDERVDADPACVRRIADLSWHLPLTLSVIGRHMREHPGWSVGDYLGPLTALTLEGGMRAAIARCDRTLPPECQRLLRLLALDHSPEFDAHTAAALADTTTATARDRLRALAAAHLITEHEPGRYRFHPIVRAYATERIIVDEPASRTRHAVTRLIEHRRPPAIAEDGTVPPARTVPDDAGAPLSSSHALAHLWRPLGADAPGPYTGHRPGPADDPAGSRTSRQGPVRTLIRG